MSATPIQLAVIGPGGLEILVVMLVLLLLFGAKDAPRIFRKLNETIDHFRNVAAQFKHEVMYGDIDDPADASEADFDPCRETADPEEELDGAAGEQAASGGDDAQKA